MPERSPLQAGVVLLDRYVLVSHLGRGLGGDTWKADPIEGGEPVAVKIIAANADRRAQRDVLNEAAFLRELDHPNVVRYLGMVDLPGGGATFLIMEFVEGGNLWEWLGHHGPCAPGLAAALLLQIAEGLRAVHGCGILHRDLKPSNVLVRPIEGGIPRMLVADLGISRRAVMNVAAITRAAGTPGYAAPEAWGGGTLSSAADVYSLGAVGWFLLTGEEPQPTFGSTYLDPLHLPGLLPVNRRVAAAGVMALVGEMLALEPSGRPSLVTVCRDLERLAQGTSPAAVRAFRASSSTRALPGPPHLTPPRRESNPSIIPEVAPEAPEQASPRPSPGSPPPIDPFETAEERGKPHRPWTVGLLVAIGLVIVCAGVAGWGWLRLRSDVTDASPSAVEPVTDAVGLPTEPVVTALPPAPAPVPVALPAAPDAAPRPEAAPRPVAGGGSGAAAPAPVPMTAPEPATGEVGRLRVGIRAPNGLPADVALVVSAPGGASNRSLSTQVVVSGARSGTVRVSLVTATTTLGQASVNVPPGPEVRVLCTALAADFSSLQCEVLP